MVDASVVVKWIFADSERETDTERATALLDAIKNGRLFPLQPPHWLAEVAAVATRLQPDSAVDAIDLLDAMELSAVHDPAVLKRASRIAHELSHHLFDTLYHALALEYGLSLVTADYHYFRKAKHLGQMVRLDTWEE